ncbi:MAG: flagellar export chaperone FliS [Armatimonadetes bacterium]|nr:flagellar export chaperone FliS [Armatimonadota bacterium]
MMQLARAYRSTQTSTASPLQLIVSLYDGAQRFLAEAERAFEAQDAAAGRTGIVRVQRIILELMAVLDHDRGGELATSLFRLYQYMIDRLAIARQNNGGPEIQEVAGMLQDLRAAWVEADRQLRQRQGSGGA